MTGPYGFLIFTVLKALAPGSRSRVLPSSSLCQIRRENLERKGRRHDDRTRRRRFRPEASSYRGTGRRDLLFRMLGLCVGSGRRCLLPAFSFSASVTAKAASSVPRVGRKDQFHADRNHLDGDSTDHCFSSFLSVAGRAIRLHVFAARRTALEIDVVGKQWMWKVQHAGRATRDQPAPHSRSGNQDIIITLTSEDVVHSFYIPAFRIKRDAVPGSYARFWFRAVEAGVVPSFSARNIAA